MSRPKKWVNPVESRIKNDSRKKSTPTKEALDGFPFPVKRDNPLGSQDSTKQLGEVAAAADNLTDGYDFSLTDNPVESPDVEQISVEEAGPVGAQDSSGQVSTGPAEASISDYNFSLIDSPAEDPNSGLFIVRTAIQATIDAKKRPIPKPLFGQLWFEGENAILFSDSNRGKTILAMQIAETISSGRCATIGLAMDAPAQKVAYCDFELSEMQFLRRYTDDKGNVYPFSSNLLRVEINPDAVCPSGLSFEDYIKMSLEQLVVQHEVNVLIIDNITYLSKALEKASDAAPLMDWLKRFGRRFGLSILVLAHTPKRNMMEPLNENHMAGSKMLINFADTIFAIGASAKDPKIRYIKELKQRDEEYKYLADNVILCEIEKPNNFLQFTFRGYGCERDHLTATQKDEEVRRAKELQSQGKTQREIAAQMGVSLGKVNNLLKP